MSDNVNHPKHYTSHPSGVECIQITECYDFCIGNAIKYLWRQGLKAESSMGNVAKQIEDCEKAIWYINRHISNLRSKHGKAKEQNESMAETSETGKCYRLDAGGEESAPRWSASESANWLFSPYSLSRAGYSTEWGGTMADTEATRSRGVTTVVTGGGDHLDLTVKPITFYNTKTEASKGSLEWCQMIDTLMKGICNESK